MQMLLRQVMHAAKLAAKRSPLAPALRAVFSAKSPLAPAPELGCTEGWGQAAQWLLLSASGKAIVSNPFALRSLRLDINRDIETELLLTAVREELLHSSRDLLPDARIQEFACAIAQQCINNEHVWFVSDGEKRKLNAISWQTVTEIPSDLGTWQELFVLSLYNPLHKLLELDSELNGRDMPTALPRCLHALVQSTLEAHEQEIAIRRSIESFGTIKNQVSKVVAAMYEAYPYSRWINMAVLAPGSRRKWLKTFF